MHKFITNDNAFIDARLNYETVIVASSWLSRLFKLISALLTSHHQTSLSRPSSKKIYDYDFIPLRMS